MSGAAGKPMRRKRALILKLGAIGDVVTTVPAARALYEQGYEIHWICGKVSQPVLECYCWIKIIPADEKAIFKGSVLQRAIGIGRLWSKIAFRAWDIAAILNYDRRYRLLILPAFRRRTAALSREAREANIIGSRSRTDEFARMMLGLEDGYREQSFAPIRPEILPQSPLPAKSAHRRIGLVPGGASNLVSTQFLRRWPIEKYAVLAEKLLERNWEVVLLGGPDDAWVRHHFEHLKIMDCVGNLSIPEVISVCDTCDAVISHDTGPLHLAGVSSACLVGIFGPTDPGNVIPRRSEVVAIWGGQRLPCRPCYDGRSFAPCQFPECLQEIQIDIVLRELDRLLNARSRGVAEPWRVVNPIPETTGDHISLVLRIN